MTRTNDQLELVSIPRVASLDGFVRCPCGSDDVGVHQDAYRNRIRCTCRTCGGDATYTVGDRYGRHTVVHRKPGGDS